MIPTPLRLRTRSRSTALSTARSKSVVGPVAAVMAAGLVLSACGDDGADGDDGDPAGGAATEEAMTEEAMTDEAMTDEAMTDEEMTDEEMADEEMTEDAAGAPAPGGGSIAAVDDLIAGLTPLEYDAASVTTATVDGGRFAAAEVAGPVVYWFWAPWCTICRAEAPEVAEVASEFEGRVTFVGVAGLGPVDDMQDFVSDTGVGGFDHAVDPDGSVWTGFGVFSQPSYVFVDSSGEARTLVGGLGGDTLRVVADALAG